MTSQSIAIRLPQDVIERLHRIADESNRSLEQVLVDSITVIAQDIDSLISDEKLDKYTDDQLWAVFHHRVAVTEHKRARELVNRSETHPLSAEEHAELDALLEILDQYMLVRSKALAILNQRGYDTAYLFRKKA